MLGIALIIAAILSVAVAFSIHPPNGFSAVTVPLPPVGSTLSPEQLAEERADPNASFHFRRQGIELFVDASFLAGSSLLITGMVKCFRKMKTVQISS